MRRAISASVFCTICGDISERPHVSQLRSRFTMISRNLCEIEYTCVASAMCSEMNSCANPVFSALTRLATGTCAST